ncbi:MAG: hypothetical protein RLZZ522_1800 [Verrucomicrobiota bacterium]
MLDAVGISDLQALAKATVPELHTELTRANRILQIAKRTPSRDNVASWVAAARVRLGVEDEPPPPASVPVDFEATAQVAEMLATAPFAIPLPARQLMDQQLAVADIPPAILLNRYSGDLEIRVVDRKAASGIPRAPLHPRGRAGAAPYVQLADPTPQRLQLDNSRVRSIADLTKDDNPLPTAAAATTSGTLPENDRVALIRTPLAATNRGRDPQSRSYIRGVLYPHPLTLAFGALITLTLAVVLVPAMLASVLLLLSVIWQDAFSWVSPWLLVFPCALPVVGLLYLIYGTKGKCRICNQRLFFPRACLKNSKAHRLFGLGYIIPVCLHMLLFSWFRCTYCGTPVRLKK